MPLAGGPVEGAQKSQALYLRRLQGLAGEGLQVCPDDGREAGFALAQLLQPGVHTRPATLLPRDFGLLAVSAEGQAGFMG